MVFSFSIKKIIKNNMVDSLFILFVDLLFRCDKRKCCIRRIKHDRGEWLEELPIVKWKFIDLFLSISFAFVVLFRCCHLIFHPFFVTSWRKPWTKSCYLSQKLKFKLPFSKWIITKLMVEQSYHGVTWPCLRKKNVSCSGGEKTPYIIFVVKETKQSK